MNLWDRLPGEPDRAYAHFLDWLQQPKAPVLALWARSRRLEEYEARELSRRWAWEDRRAAWEIHTGSLYFSVRERQTVELAEAVTEATTMAAALARLTNRKVQAMLTASAAAPGAAIDDARVPSFARTVGRLTRDLDRTASPLSIAAPSNAGMDLSLLSDEELDTYRALIEKMTGG